MRHSPKATQRWGGAAGSPWGYLSRLPPSEHVPAARGVGRARAEGHVSAWLGELTGTWSHSRAPPSNPTSARSSQSTVPSRHLWVHDRPHIGKPGWGETAVMLGSCRCTPISTEPTHALPICSRQPPNPPSAAVCKSPPHTGTTATAASQQWVWEGGPPGPGVCRGRGRALGSCKTAQEGQPPWLRLPLLSAYTLVLFFVFFTSVFIFFHFPFPTGFPVCRMEARLSCG